MPSPACMTLPVLCFILTFCLVNGVTMQGRSLSTASFRDIPYITFLECRKECMSRQKCKAFNFRRHFGLCLLLDKDSSSVGSDPDPRVVYSEKIDWKMKTLPTTCETKCGQNKVCRLNGDVTVCQTEECDEPDEIVSWETRFGNMRQIRSKVLHQLRCFEFNPGTFVTSNIQSICNENGDWSSPYVTCYENINSFVHHLGCFRDDDPRVLPYGRHSDPKMTIAMCALHCRQQNNNNTFFGVQFGSECYCGLTFNSIGKSTECTKPCGGDSTTLCGGIWASNIYNYTKIVNV